MDPYLFDDFVNAKRDQSIAVIREGFHPGDDPSIAQQLTTVSTQQVHLPLKIQLFINQRISGLMHEPSLRSNQDGTMQ